MLEITSTVIKCPIVLNLSFSCNLNQRLWIFYCQTMRDTSEIIYKSHMFYTIHSLQWLKQARQVEDNVYYISTISRTAIVCEPRYSAAAAAIVQSKVPSQSIMIRYAVSDQNCITVVQFFTYQCLNLKYLTYNLMYKIIKKKGMQKLIVTFLQLGYSH